MWAGCELGREDLYRKDEKVGRVVDILSQIERIGVKDDKAFEELLGGCGVEGLGGARRVGEGKIWGVELGRRKLLENEREIRSMYEGIISIVPAVGLVLFCSDELENLFKFGSGYLYK